MRNKHDSRAESFIDINVAYFCRYVKHKYVNNCRKGKNKSTCESSLSVCLPAFLPISLVDIAQHTSAYTHNCISYSNTPNTGCPVLGVHIKKYDVIEKGQFKRKESEIYYGALAQVIFQKIFSYFHRQAVGD